MKVFSMRNLMAALAMVSQGPAFALEVHEWGTFTSLINQNGTLMSGMQHEEEGLPGFVYGLRQEAPNGLKSIRNLSPRGCGYRTKCAFSDSFPFNHFNTTVTQKMETPVVYFYGKSGEKVHLEVQFPEGMISQWYPAASNLNLHQESLKEGHMSWDVTLKAPTETKSYPQTTPGSVWNPARMTKANTIQVNSHVSEEERFIFYRGLGEFTVPLKLTLKNSGRDNLLVTMKNDSNEKIPALFYIRSTKKEGILKAMILPSLAPHEERTFETKGSTDAERLIPGLKQSLIAEGLFEDEAMSMINTWNKSYFHTEGERLLYILPRKWTDKILPMKVAPTPEKLNRVLVGRIELFSEAAQQELENRISLKQLPETDHLLEAKLNATKISEKLKETLVQQMNQ